MSKQTARRQEVGRQRLLATAYHEAGHAVVGFYSRHMPKVRRVSIVPDSKNGTVGHVVHHPSPAFVRQLEEGDWNAAIEVRFYEQIRTLYAGGVAERRFTGRRNHVGGRGDYEIISELAVHVSGGGGPVTQALLRWLRLSAEAYVTARWREIEAVAGALVEHKVLRGHDAVANVIFKALGIDVSGLTVNSAVNKPR